MQNNSTPPNPFEVHAPAASNPPVFQQTLVQQIPELSHSGPGIASFITSIVGIVLTLLLVLIGALIESGTPGGLNDDSSAAVMLGLSFFGIMGLTLISGVLGIVGLFQSNRKKIFAILGLVFSSCFFLLLFLIIILAVTIT